MAVMTDLSVSLEEAREIADQYVSAVLGQKYTIRSGKKRDDHWRFTVICDRNDMNRTPAVGGVSVNFFTGKVDELTDERIRDMQEAAAVQVAQERGELARDDNGFVLRYHARIKANAWTTNNIDHKVGARDGFLIPVETPIWRFSIKDSLVGAEDIALDVIDVDAKTGQVLPLTEHQLKVIVGGVCAARKRKEQATTARQRLPSGMLQASTR